jgi:beta-lactamase class A
MRSKILIGAQVAYLMATFIGCAAYIKSLDQIPVEQSHWALHKVQPSPELDHLVTRCVTDSVHEVGEGHVTTDTVWVTLIDLRDPHYVILGHYRGDEPVYPASVIKAAYMLAVFHQARDGMLPMTRIVKKDLKLMIGISDNEATNRLLDRLTGTESGPELPREEFATFRHKRYTVDRYLKYLGLPGIFAIQKTWSDAPYGRDVQLLGRYTGDHYQYSNKMTANDTARLLYLIAEKQTVDRQSCGKMLKLMERCPKRAKQQSVKRIAAGLPNSAKVWSKAGWTGLENHDAAIVRLAGGTRFVLVVFTLYREKETDIIQRITEKVVAALAD